MDQSVSCRWSALCGQCLRQSQPSCWRGAAERCLSSPLQFQTALSCICVCYLISMSKLPSLHF